MERKIGCVIMASGKSVRLGRNKLTERFQGKTFIQHILDKTEGLFAKRVVVTRSKEVVEICEMQGIEVIFHSFPNRNDTVRIGISRMEGMEACIFCPCDQPLLRKSSLERMINAFHSKDEIIRLSYGDTVGTPAMFGKSYFKELQELPEKSGGSFLIKKYPLFVKCVEASGEEELFDLDEEKDFVQLNEYLFKSFAD